MIGVLEQAAAQTVDVGKQRFGMRRGLRPVEQRVRIAGGAGARMRERADVEQAGVVRPLADRLAKGVARIPRRTAVEVRADVVDRRGQDARASAISERNRRTLISLRTCCGCASTSASACFKSAAPCGEPASADA